MKLDIMNVFTIATMLKEEVTVIENSNGKLTS